MPHNKLMIKNMIKIILIYPVVRYYRTILPVIIRSTLISPKIVVELLNGPQTQRFMCMLDSSYIIFLLLYYHDNMTNLFRRRPTCPKDPESIIIIIYFLECKIFIHVVHHPVNNKKRENIFF